ncbi:MAG: YggT family protein [bacterium]
MDFVIFVINFIFSLFFVLLAVRAILPWVPHNKQNPLFSPIYFLTEPFLSVVRAGLPPARIGMDVSPFVVIILLWFLQQIILWLLL